MQPEPGATLDPAVVTQIRTHPDVAQVLPQKNVEIAVPTGVDTLFRLIGLQEADVDTVLAQCGVTLVEGQVASESRLVFTYGNQKALFHKQADMILFSLSLVEGIIALVAALALAGLNYVFVTQRQSEMGVLNVLGLSRLQLVGRILRETFFTTGAAWLMAALGCAVVLLGLQHGLYVPLGLELNLFNLTPWFYTLLVPVAVLAVNAGAVG